MSKRLRWEKGFVLVLFKRMRGIKMVDLVCAGRQGYGLVHLKQLRMLLEPMMKQLG